MAGLSCKVDSSVAMVEQLLSTRVFHYLNLDLGDTLSGFDNYTLPESVLGAIDYVEPTGILRPSPKFRTRGSSKERNRLEKAAAKIRRRRADPDIGPQTLRDLYHIPPNNQSTSPHNGIGIYEPGLATWLPDDLDLFFATYQPEIKGQRPSVMSIAGGYRDPHTTDEYFIVESNLDFEYAMALAHPQAVVTLQVNDPEHVGSLTAMLRAFNQPHCQVSVDTPDGPVVRAVPLEELEHEHGVGANCTALQTPNVVSISYAWGERDFAPDYLRRQCLEFLKLGLQGVTVVVASGDSGPARHYDGACVDGATGADAKGAAGGDFVANWPAACPWVTVAGGTQLRRQTERVVAWRNRPSAAWTAGGAKGDEQVRPLETDRDLDPEKEVAYARHVKGRSRSSGGGFSALFPAPWYQRPAVSAYLAHEADHLAALAGRFNASGRAYPDVAALAAGFAVATGGTRQLVYGTSASAPVFAAVVARVNDVRRAAGRSAVGFVNPVLYARPEALTAITSGANVGCGVEEAFRAQGRWSPVTGLGSPDYEKLVETFMALP